MGAPSVYAQDDPPMVQCADGADNDADEKIDYPDDGG